MSRWTSMWRWIAAGILALVLALVVVRVHADEVVRRRMERELNAQLDGYQVQLPAVELHPLGFSVTLKQLRIVQTAHPNPPVAFIPRLEAGVDWRALLRLRLVAHFELDQPQVQIDRSQFQSEARDAKSVTDKGWQRAAESIYPLKINRFEIRDGLVTYVDDPHRPLRLRHLDLVAENIRNIRSRDHVYPSTLHADARLFDAGRLAVRGRADFLAEPQAALDVDVTLDGAPLAALNPVVTRANIRMQGGILTGKGHIEYAPRRKSIRLEHVGIDGLRVDYVHTQRTRDQETARLERAKAVAREVSNEPTTSIRIDALELKNAELAYVDADRQMRLFLDDADVTVRHVSNQNEPTPAQVEVRGQFMGAGPTTVDTTFRPIDKTPDFDLAVKIENTPLTTLNEVFRAYGNFDVAAGSFAFYSELSAHKGRLRGYIKPFFTDMHVYDSEQDRNKPVLNKVYEGVVGGVAHALENSQDNVATDAEISGQIDDPNVSAWEIALGLIRNAFFKAVVPGFESQPRDRSSSG